MRSGILLFFLGWHVTLARVWARKTTVFSQKYSSTSKALSNGKCGALNTCIYLIVVLFYSTGQSSSLDAVFYSIGLRSLYVDQFEASFSVKTWHKASLNNIHSKPYEPLTRALWRRKIRTPNMSLYNIFPEIDQIQEKKTTKSTIRTKSKNSSFVPSLSHLQKPYDNLYETKVWSA